MTRITRRDFGMMALGSFPLLSKNARKASSPLLQSAASGPAAFAEGSDVRRVGIRAHGAYWSAGHGKIDLLSGNLNFSLPLIRAMGRKSIDKVGWSYNSQLWRMDANGLQNFGADLGYGFGWRAQLGSIQPLLSKDLAVIGYTFINATGAEYPLTLVDGVWVSLQGVHITYDPATRRLYFPSGRFWIMGCVSASAEPDAGTLYPTWIQDSNGNQVNIRYLPGRGAGRPNTSARIQEIQDVRAQNTTSGRRTFSFIYSAEALPHLISVTSDTATDENYRFTYSAPQALQPPFGKSQDLGLVVTLQAVAGVAGASCACGSGGRSYVFSYSPDRTGELTGVSLPHGGQVGWAYATSAFADGRTVREVQACTLVGAANGADIAYAIEHPAGDTANPVHSATTLRQQGQPARKAWTFNTTPGSAELGLLSAFEVRPQDGQPAFRRKEYRWAKGQDGTVYRAAATTTLDPGTPNQKQRRTEKDRDRFGNVIETRYFEYDKPNFPARVVRRSYLSDSVYTSRYIRNRLVSKSVTDGTETSELVRRVYDSTPLTARSGLNEHDSVNFGTSFMYRGNATEVVSRGIYRRISYDVTGFRVGMVDSQNYSVAISPADGSNNSRPGLVVPNSNIALGTSSMYDSALRLISTAGPNGAAKTQTYDGFGRLATLQSAGRAQKVYSYTDGPTTVTTTTSGRWRKTTFDGFGRRVRIERGDPAGTSAAVEIEYDSVHRHKASRISAAHAPGVKPDWKAYSYDALARMVKTEMAGGSGTRTYEYVGNTVTTTGPSGRWKKRVYSASRRLLQVITSNPAGGPDLETRYQYNALKKLTDVVMPRPAATQRRSFRYDAGGRLLTRQHVESGLERRAYNSDGSLASQTDAKGQKLVFTYDSYKRPVSVIPYTEAGLPDPAHAVRMYYDVNPFDAGYSQNAMSRLAAVQWGAANSGAGLFTEMYSYAPSGQVTAKRLRINRGKNDVDLDVTYGYDGEGRLNSISYAGGAVSRSLAYDSLGRPVRVTDTVARQDLVKDVRFDAVGRITAVKSLIPGSDDYYLEQRAYNARGQLTRIHAGPEQPNAADAWMPVVDLAYHYSNDKNDGKIQRVSDSIAGDDIQYRYDALGRLISAGTVGSGWGLAFEYDDFGNRTAQKVTKGQAPATQTAYDPATNRISDSQTSYDANGNLVRTQDLRLQYDVRNRLTQATHVLNGVEQYAYDPTGNRIWKKSPDGHEQIHLHGFAGRELATYDVRTDVQGNLSLHLVDTNLYFHSRQIRAGGELLVKDRVRSVRARIGEVNGPQAETSSFFPYGEEQQPSDQDRKKFGSYTRDSASGLDYAKHRYYASFVGRFLTPDPAECSAHLADPGRWNKYAFVGNDPVNRVDPRGLQWGSGSSSGGGGGSSSGGGGGSSSGGGGGSSSGGGSGGPCAHQCPEGVRFCDDPCQGGGGSSGGGGGGGGYGSGGSSGGSGGGGSSGGGSSGGNGSGSNGGGGGGGTGDPACLAGCSMVCAGILIGCGLSCNPYRFIPELYVPCMAGCLVIEGICIYGCYRACGY